MTLKATPYPPVNLIHVGFMKGSTQIPMGRLVLHKRKILFEYDRDFLNTNLDVSPFKLPLKPGLIPCDDRVFDGLFGVFNDSLPDGWGRLLLDRKLRHMGLNPGDLSPLDRLRFVGKHGMGALLYEPPVEDHQPHTYDDYDVIETMMMQFQDQEDDRFVDDLLSLNGSSAGARPKILVQINQEDWLIKFRSSFDPNDSGAIEYAYHLMAKQAGLNVPEAHLFPSKNCPGYFGVKRFDKVGSQRIHMHTVSGLLHLNNGVPSLDYETILQVTLRLTKDVREVERQLRCTAFNVLAHNRDDHSKNFSFLMNADGLWGVSPAYDITFSSGPGGEHCTTLMGEGKNPTYTNLVSLVKTVGLDIQRIKEISDEVGEAVSCWDTFANQAGVSKKSSLLIKDRLKQIKDKFYF